MTYHPLRDTLKQKDWMRLAKIMNGSADTSKATTEEFQAASDVFYDKIAAVSQTHLGVYTLQ